jgi:hypothetical protein
MRWLSQEYPHLVDGYTRLYADKYAPASYRQEVRNVVGLLRNRLGIDGREETAAGVTSPAPRVLREAEQQMLAFRTATSSSDVRSSAVPRRGTRSTPRSRRDPTTR